MKIQHGGLLLALVVVVVASFLIALYFLSQNQRVNPSVTSEQGSAASGEPTASSTPEASDIADLPASELAAQGEQEWQAAQSDAQREHALALLRAAFKKGEHSATAYRLGYAYYSGQGVAKDLNTAYRYLSLPELSEDRYAQYYLGLILTDPSFPGQDVAKGRAALEKAKAMGQPDAASALDHLGQ